MIVGSWTDGLFFFAQKPAKAGRLSLLPEAEDTARAGARLLDGLRHADLPETVRRIAEAPSGIVLVTGAGSGIGAAVALALPAATAARFSSTCRSSSTIPSLPTALITSMYGWPGSVFEFMEIIPRLTDPARLALYPLREHVGVVAFARVMREAAAGRQIAFSAQHVGGMFGLVFLVLSGAALAHIHFHAATGLPAGPDASDLIGRMRRYLADDLDTPTAFAVLDRWAADPANARG